MRSIEAAANALRQDDVSLPAAVRWLRRRVRAVQAVLHAVYDLPLSAPGMYDIHTRLDEASSCTLQELRRELPPQLLSEVPAPLGFLPSQQGVSNLSAPCQQDMGPDGSRDRIYAIPVNSQQTVCDSNPPIPANPEMRRRRQRLPVCGVATVP
jgi:hypothetical protein